VVKSELVRVLQGQFTALQQRDVELAVNCMLEQMVNALANGERIEIRGFGAFSKHQRAPRLARNPKPANPLIYRQKHLSILNR